MSAIQGIHLKLRRPLDTAAERKRFAAFVAQTIDRGPKDSLPHAQNDSEAAYQFRLDGNNDYFLSINDLDPSITTIVMRYNDTEVKCALLTWIGHAWDGSKIVKPEGAQ